MDTVHYHIRSYRCLTNGLAERLLETTLTMDHDIDDWERVLHSGEASVYTLTDQWGYLHIVLHYDRTILDILYLGKQDILNFLPLYEAAITE